MTTIVLSRYVEMRWILHYMVEIATRHKKVINTYNYSIIIIIINYFYYYYLFCFLKLLLLVHVISNLE